MTESRRDNVRVAYSLNCYEECHFVFVGWKEKMERDDGSKGKGRGLRTVGRVGNEGEGYAATKTGRKWKGSKGKEERKQNDGSKGTGRGLYEKGEDEKGKRKKRKA